MGEKTKIDGEKAEYIQIGQQDISEPFEFLEEERPHIPYRESVTHQSIWFGN